MARYARRWPAEIRLHLGLDDKNDGSEPGTPGVIKGKVNENMTIGIDWGDLLGAAEAAAHPGGHNQKSGLRCMEDDLLFFAAAQAAGISRAL